MIVFVGDHVGAKPTHLLAVEHGVVTAIRSTCGGRRCATLADSSGAIRRGQPVGSLLVSLGTQVESHVVTQKGALAYLERRSGRLVLVAHGNRRPDDSDEAYLVEICRALDQPVSFLGEWNTVAWNRHERAVATQAPPGHVVL